jgi:phage shock protein E
MLRRFVLLVALLFVPACSKPTSEGEPSATKTPSAQETAWAAIRSGALLVDVRSQEEFDQGHLDGAALIPHTEIAARASELGDDKDRVIVLYCRTGNRSGKAKRTLEELGYTHVMNAGAYESLKRSQ